ncbi:MAG TPA: DUF1499 domain-containing protein [Nevskiaceae bacterium]|nr:DUF1499 domain-containing protein [Nevskiaceae bacterium]
MPNLTESVARWMPALVLLLTACGVGPVAERTGAGALLPCPSAPHCVSSVDEDPDHHVNPLIFRGSVAQARAHLVAALKSLPRTEIVAEEPRYLRAESRSTLMRFVDDVQCVIQPAAMGAGGVIELRSSSRVGYYDFGANRERIESLRKAFAAAEAGP